MAIVRNRVFGSFIPLHIGLLIIGIFSEQAHADIVVSTYGPGYTFGGQSTGDTTKDTGNDGLSVVIAGEFYVTAKTRFTGAKLAVSGFAPNVPIIVAIAADAGAQPPIPNSMLLESIAATADTTSCCVTSLGGGTFTGPGVSVKASGSLILEANTHYWVEIIVPHSNWNWNEALPGTSANGDNIIAAGIYNAATQTVSSLKEADFTGPPLAFEIYGTPEPQSPKFPCGSMSDARARISCEQAIDPMALILSPEAYLIWVQIHHPDGPRIAEIQATLQRMAPEARRAALLRAKTLADYGKAFEKANATLKKSRQK